MFERLNNNVQKGRFGQALAQTFMEKGVECHVPDYIKNAVAFACQGTQVGT
jgi:putative ATP-dependent endonuclease of OLD family